LSQLPSSACNKTLKKKDQRALPSRIYKTGDFFLDSAGNVQISGAASDHKSKHVTSLSGKKKKAWEGRAEHNYLA